MIARGISAWGISMKISYPVMYPILHVSYTGSTFMLVLVSFQRFKGDIFRIFLLPNFDTSKFILGHAHK